MENIYSTIEALREDKIRDDHIYDVPEVHSIKTNMGSDDESQCPTEDIYEDMQPVQTDGKASITSKVINKGKNVCEAPKSQKVQKRNQLSKGCFAYTCIKILLFVIVTCSIAGLFSVVLHVSNNPINAPTKQIGELVEKIEANLAKQNNSIQEIRHLYTSTRLSDLHVVQDIHAELNKTNNKILAVEAQQNTTNQDVSDIQTQLTETIEGILTLEVQQNATHELVVDNIQTLLNETDIRLQAFERQQNNSTQEVNTLKLEQSNIILDILRLRDLQNSASLQIEMLQAKLSQLQRETGYELQTINALLGKYRIVLELICKENNCTVNVSNPVTSCKDIPRDGKSGEYWAQTDITSSPVLVYCDNNPRNCSCNSSAGGWMRVANIDMTDPSQECPPGFRLINRTTAPHRTCGRPGDSAGCVSTTFPVFGIEYSRVCGRVIGYQVGTPNAFKSLHTTRDNIDIYYIDGISLTHGLSSRKHIWSFVGAVSEAFPSASNQYDINICPCTINESTYGADIPQMNFINDNYFCDTALKHHHWTAGFFYPDDPLWDGQGCGSTSSCCSFNNPPWFCTQLPQPTTDDIELRVCNNQGISQDDTPFERVEIYIQ